MTLVVGVGECVGAANAVVAAKARVRPKAREWCRRIGASKWGSGRIPDEMIEVKQLLKSRLLCLDRNNQPKSQKCTNKVQYRSLRAKLRRRDFRPLPGKA